MTVVAVSMLRVQPGRLGEVLENLRMIKKAVERAGGTYTVRRQIVGPQPNNIFAVAQYPDWSALAKARSDTELRQLMERVRSNSNPAAELLTSSILEDVPL